ncbi:MAG TPA: MFS transporter [Candidatus Acidoferrales bacterium]|nr:MFS transporter [Candidatus Acidoferrales bacterium]
MKFLNESESPTKEHFRILALSWAGWVFDFYDLILFTFLLIPIGKELALSNVSVSLIMGASLAATALGGIIFGFLSDKFGRKSVLQWTIVTYSVGTFLSGFASDIETLLVFRIVTGLGVGGEWATGQTLIGETFPPNIRGRFSAIMQTGAPIGIIFASVVGGFLEPAIGWRICFFVSVVPAVLVVFVRKHLPESDIWLAHRRIVADGKLPEWIPSGDLLNLERERGAKFRLLLSKDYLKIFLRSLLLAVFLMSAYWFTYSWLPGYLHEQRHFTMTRSALWMIVTQGGGVLGYFSFGFTADMIGRRPAFTIYSILWAVGLLMITVLWNMAVAYPVFILGFMFLVGFGTGVFSGFGPLCTELFPTSIRNTAMGTSFNLARGIQFFTPIAIAVASKTYGLSGGISIAALFAVLTGIWIWTFPETRGKKIGLLSIEP